MAKYHTVFITNLPSFYKINLYNRIAEKNKIFVIFLNETDQDRNKDFFKGKRNFNYASLNNKTALQKSLMVCKLLRYFSFNRIIVGGWDEVAYWVAVLFSQRKKNGVVIESSILESDTRGFNAFLKRAFLRRVSTVYASGKSQAELVKALKYNGYIKITKGVGIFNLVTPPSPIMKKSIKNFLFVGRLAKEKNLECLINTFKNFPTLKLNIIGFGPLEEKLKNIGGSNVVFHGAVDNKDLPSYYSKNDVFILPSLIEPWGLVVEEAFNNGLPVIVSNKVGCASQIVNDSNGLIFSTENPDSLRDAINKMRDTKFYTKLVHYINGMDLHKVESHQVNSYIE